MASKNEQMAMYDKKDDHQDRPITCLGMTFKNHEVRRAYFTEELRKKLTELKKIEGFPFGEDEDILALSDPPYYTACPNPWINEFIETWEREKVKLCGVVNKVYHRGPFTADVSEGKNDPVYNAHSYHTKVPHKAIMRYILHYTNPGDIVYDGFAGTGMTGVAASLCGNELMIKELGYTLDREGNILDQELKNVSRLGARKAILGDLSPIATYIAQNYNTPLEVKEFEKEAIQILNSLEQQYGWMYQTNHDETTKANINYVVWSDVFICPHCTNDLVFFDVAVDNDNGKVFNEFDCPNCGAKLYKKVLEKKWETKIDCYSGDAIQQVQQVPVLINYSIGRKQYNKKPDEHDLRIIKEIDNINIPFWYPSLRMPEGDESRRNDRTGLTHIHHLYTKRNLYILSSIKDAIEKSKHKNVLRLLFTSHLVNLSKLNRYRPGVSFPYNPLSGTLYIGSQISEANVFSAYKNKIQRIIKAFHMIKRQTIVETRSLIANEIKDQSIDYIFTDPPFGANIMYSELSFIWEAWLGVTTNNISEAIINKTHQKGLHDYQSLMENCFKEYYRVLKPGRWMTVEFSNSQSSVWNAIQEAIQRAGFVIANVSALDKKLGSFKAVTTTTAVKQDLVISAYKPKDEHVKKIYREQNTEESAWTFVKQHLEQLPVFVGVKGEVQMIVERTPRILFDRMVSYHVQSGLPVPISSAEFQAGIVQRFPMRDGMAFLESQVAEYDKRRILVKEFSQMSLFVSDENSAIEWIRQQLMNKPQTRQDLHPNYMKQIQHIAKHELLPELDQLLEQNFLMYDGKESVPSQIHTYLSTNYKDLRGLDKNDPRLKEKAKNRWYVPDPNKQADLEKLREKSLLREFANYKEELEKSKKKLKQFRTEAIRAGFKKAWGEKDFETIVKIGERLPESVIQEDDKLLMYFDNAQIRLGM